MRIETERLIIRSLTLEDEQAFIEMASDGSLMEIFGGCSQSDTWMEEWIRESMQLEEQNDPNREYLAFVIEEKTDNRAVGSVGTSYYEDIQKTGITYFIGSRFRGQGYGAEAVSGFVQHFFKHYDTDTLIARARVRNEASCKTLERAGFVLYDTDMYQDMFDETPELSNFYQITKGTTFP